MARDSHSKRPPGRPRAAPKPASSGPDGRSSPKKPNHVDLHLASRLRLRRILLGLSQEELGKRLGLTAQQIQKYEAGATRMSASRLHDLAAQLAVPITWFFEELPAHDQRRTAARAADGPEETSLSQLMARREAHQLVELYFGIDDEELRKKVLEMTHLLAQSARK